MPAPAPAPASDTMGKIHRASYCVLSFFCSYSQQSSITVSCAIIQLGKLSKDLMK